MLTKSHQSHVKSSKAVFSVRFPCKTAELLEENMENIKTELLLLHFLKWFLRSSYLVPWNMQIAVFNTGNILQYPACEETQFMT